MALSELVLLVSGQLLSHLCCRMNLVDTGAFLGRTTWKWKLGSLMNPNVSEDLY